MASSRNIATLATMAFSSRDEDPSRFVLYQPSPNKQMLLYEAASSSSTLCFLKMHQIETDIKQVTNAESMSDNGRTPVVWDRERELLMCGFNEVFWHVSRKMDHKPTLQELTYLDWVQSNFLELEYYICWCHEPFVYSHTQPRFTYDLPWPISTILFKRKMSEIQQNIGKKYSSFDHLLDKFDSFLTKLDKRIDSKHYCLDDTSPSCVDALIYGHVEAIRRSNLDLTKLRTILDAHRRVENLKDSMHSRYPAF